MIKKDFLYDLLFVITENRNETLNIQVGLPALQSSPVQHFIEQFRLYVFRPSSHLFVSISQKGFGIHPLKKK